MPDNPVSDIIHNLSWCEWLRIRQTNLIAACRSAEATTSETEIWADILSSFLF